MKAILRNKFILIGGTIILIIVVLVLLAPVLTPYEYGSVDLGGMCCAASSQAGAFPSRWPSAPP